MVWQRKSKGMASEVEANQEWLQSASVLNEREDHSSGTLGRGICVCSNVQNASGQAPESMKEN